MDFRIDHIRLKVYFSVTALAFVIWMIVLSTKKLHVVTVMFNYFCNSSQNSTDADFLASGLKKKFPSIERKKSI